MPLPNPPTLPPIMAPYLVGSLDVAVDEGGGPRALVSSDPRIFGSGLYSQQEAGEPSRLVKANAVDLEREGCNDPQRIGGLEVESLYKSAWSDGAAKWLSMPRGSPLGTCELGFQA
ncbi:hypothetical protein GUJ93_ZPchr0002g23955 [Zizania palustris]|uniref:Uncharacterized protein n=1 Tax=Zizania palustris TaxID=103762 RepID=A0A8J5RVD7_ZIZPA|nr:hypothetical protein GUJ93_ZPchr0002g23955 [Zizania palustris]